MTSHKGIFKFYASDFDGDKLQLHRDMFLDEAKSKKVPIKNVNDVLKQLKLMKDDDALRQMLPKLNKILCIMLVLTLLSCTSEKSFSALRRLKT